MVPKVPGPRPAARRGRGGAGRGARGRKGGVEGFRVFGARTLAPAGQLQVLQVHLCQGVAGGPLPHPPPRPPHPRRGRAGPPLPPLLAPPGRGCLPPRPRAAPAGAEGAPSPPRMASAVCCEALGGVADSGLNSRTPKIKEPSPAHASLQVRLCTGRPPSPSPAPRPPQRPSNHLAITGLVVRHRSEPPCEAPRPLERVVLVRLQQLGTTLLRLPSSSTACRRSIQIEV